MPFWPISELNRSIGLMEDGGEQNGADWIMMTPCEKQAVRVFRVLHLRGQSKVEAVCRSAAWFVLDNNNNNKSEESAVSKRQQSERPQDSCYKPVKRSSLIRC